MLCVLAERSKLSDAELTAAVHAAGASPLEHKVLDGRRNGTPTLEQFEAYAAAFGNGTARCFARMMAGIRAFEASRIAEPMFNLKGRGPFVSLGPGESDVRARKRKQRCWSTQVSADCAVVCTAHLQHADAHRDQPRQAFSGAQHVMQLTATWA